MGNNIDLNTASLADKGDDDHVYVKVPPGRYVVTHYYDTTPDPKGCRLFKYSTVEKKGQ